MDSKNKAIIVVAVVIVLIVAVFAAQSLNKDKDSDDTATVTFLIQDNCGVYFWVDGEGKTVFDAFADAANDFNMPFEASHDSYGDGIKSLFGLEMKSEGSTWTWWQQFTYADGAWTSSNLTMEKLDAKDNQYFAVVYSDGSLTPAVTDVSKAVVWDKSTDGTLFTIGSDSGMYFRVNGTGETVFDAWESAMKKYNVPYEASNWASGKGVTSMFGKAYNPNTWAYWTTFAVTDSAWSYSELLIGNMKTSENAQVLLAYGNFYGGAAPSIPLYA